jgi:acyl-coenzyme A thioesterase PaaI-like protein
MFVAEPDGSFWCDVELAEAYSGEPGIVHGGIQATVLDEVMGHAAQRQVAELADGKKAVTASFELRCCAPCATGERVRVSGAVASVEWPSIHVAGTIVESDGRLLTEATARWRVLDVDAPDASSRLREVVTERQT